MEKKSFDLIVIGAGPGGYVAAIRGAQLGLRVACVEAEALHGGTCLRVGCIPSKALLESSELYARARGGLAEHGVLAQVELDLATMMWRKTKIVTTLAGGVAHLLKKNGVVAFQGRGRIAGAGGVIVAGADGDVELAASHVLIATGSRSADLPGVDLDGVNIGTSTEALAWDGVPEHLVVIGAGAIGLELGSVWARLGARVTVLEYADRVLPEMDRDVSAEAQKLLKRQGLTFHLGARVTRAYYARPSCFVEYDGEVPVQCDRVLLAVGRAAYTEGLGLESVGLATDARGRIPVDGTFRTTVAGIYAIGDVIAGPMLAHKAEEEGVACVEGIVNGYGHVDYATIPNVVYTHPEIASVGETEQGLEKAGVPYRVGRFPFRGNGRALCLAEGDGFAKILAHAETDRVLGVHIIGARAGDLIAEAAAAMAYGASSEDIARTCHAHPTLPEVLKEAALDVDGRAIHKG